jgi:transcriptional regulator with XRE-family HTH domain
MTPQERKIYAPIGARVREARKRAGYRQGELAAHIGWTRTSVVNLEQGRQAAPLANLIMLAEWLDVAPAWLVFGESDEGRRLRALLHNEIMPRYAEMFSAGGLGDPAESVVWQLIKDIEAPVPQEPVVAAALSLVSYAEGVASQTPPISAVNFVTGGHYRALAAAVRAYREAQELEAPAP